MNRLSLLDKLALGERGKKEFYWKGFQGGPEIFTHVLYDHYSGMEGPDGTDWEHGKAGPVLADNMCVYTLPCSTRVANLLSPPPFFFF